MRIGVDVGGTNTDAVIVEGDKVIASYKGATTEDVSTGVQQSVIRVLADSRLHRNEIDTVIIGTTQFTNAVVQRSNLMETAIIRLGLPSSSAVPPMSGWPDDLADSLGRHIYMVQGGYEYTGIPITELDWNEIDQVIADIKVKGLGAVAISCIFSPVKSDSEQAVAARIRERMPDIHITASHEIGRMGLLERENATMLNSSLKALAQGVIDSFKNSLQELSIDAPLFVSQNDGTIMNADFAARYPMLTFSSGPTNSMRGAAHLSGLLDAIVIDVGGTTADIGMLSHGFPRESSLAIEVGGVPTNFRMPDLLSLGLGGGTYVYEGGQRIGPKSCGYRLLEEALCFGGHTLTATDIGVAAGIVEIGDSNALASVPHKTVKAALKRIREMLADGVAKIKTRREDLPVVAVGGGAFLVDADLPGASEVIRPEYSGVANAFGAAMAQVGGEVEKFYPSSYMKREQAIADSHQSAIMAAEQAGAVADTIKIVDIEETSLAYMAEDTLRIRAKAVGDLDMSTLLKGSHNNG